MSAATGHLTVVHAISIFAYPTPPTQMSDRPCGKGRHRHDYTIRLEVIAPSFLVTDDASMRLRTAAAALERAEGPLLGKDLACRGDVIESEPDLCGELGWVLETPDCHLACGGLATVAIDQDESADAVDGRVDPATPMGEMPR